MLDFGLVLAADEAPEGLAPLDVDDADESDVATTLPGTVLGTPAYMAPEQMNGEDVDARADQFSLCVALFEALHGQRPFKGDSLTEISDSIRKRAARPVFVRDERIPAAIADVIERGLSTNPADRYPTMDAFIEALTVAQQHRARVERSELERRAEDLNFAPKAQTRGRYAALIAVVLAGVVAVLYLLRTMGLHEAGYPDALVLGGIMNLLYAGSERRIAAAGDNAFGARWGRVLAVAPWGVLYALALSWMVGLPFTVGLALAFVAAGAATLSITAFIDPRLTIASVFLFAAAPALAFAPRYRALWVVVAIVGFYVTMTFVWRRREPIE
ncbi:MAG: protein kinase [Myxococcota bacterium]